MIGRAVVLGSRGFIGSKIVEYISSNMGIETIGIDRDQLDLTDPNSVAELAGHFDPTTTVIHCAAVKRQLGDTPATLLQNVAMVANLAEAISQSPIKRCVLFSSTAVYGEDIENLAISESTTFSARTYYGLAKQSAEWILLKTFESQPQSSLGVLRPATIYGPNEIRPSYGPAAFLADAIQDKKIVLWGDGTELREFIFIDDLVRLSADFAFMDYNGAVNVVSGKSHTFRKILNNVATVLGRPALDFQVRPRTKPKVDHGFDNSRLKTLFPNFQFTSLEAGIEAMYESMHPVK